MKRLIILVFVFLPLLSHAQGFFKPVTTDIFPQGADRSMASVWLVRPMVQLSAMQINLGSPTTVQPLSSLGTGVSYAKFTPNENGEPYQVFSANLLVLFGTEMVEVAPMKLSIAAGVTCWQYLSIGFGYSFTDKRAFLLTGISYSFN